MLDPYQVLGLDRSSAAADVRRAYRRLARKWHPDMTDDPEAADRFEVIHRAYCTVSSHLKHRRPGHPVVARHAPGGPRSFGELVCFGGSARGPDVRVGVDLSAKLAEKGGVLRIVVPRAVIEPMSGYVVIEDVDLDVAIPAGVLDGDFLRVDGEGSVGEGSAANGDLWLEVRVGAPVVAGAIAEQR